MTVLNLSKSGFFRHSWQKRKYVIHCSYRYIDRKKKSISLLLTAGLRILSRIIKKYFSNKKYNPPMIELQGRLYKYFALMSSDIFDGNILLLLRLVILLNSTHLLPFWSV